MKKMTTTVLAVTLAGSLVATPVSAFAAGNRGGKAQAAIGAAIMQPMGMMQPSNMVRSLGWATNMAMGFVNDQAMRQSGGRLEIKDPGTYVLTGSMRGTVDVNPGQGDVTLIMDNASIDGNGGPAIMGRSGDSLTIVMPEGTNNRMTGVGQGNANMPAIQGNVNVAFEGNGSMTAIDSSMPGQTQAPTQTQFGVRAQMPGQGQMPGQSQPQAPFQNQVANLAQMPTQIPMTPTQGQAPTQTPAQIPTQTPTQAGTQTPTQGQGFEWNGSGFQPDGQQMPGNMGQAGRQTTIASSTNEASQIVTSTATNTAADLVADYDNATTYTMSDDNSQVKISDSGTYVVTGVASDGNITVKKGTTGVVLVLEDLDLTSTTGATVSVNKEAEVQIVISGNVTLTDNENPADEESTDAEVADAYDGAALKVKANAQVYLTGDGTLTINGNAKNGIKTGNDSSLVIDGEDLTIDITAANDGINANYDLTILDGNVTINAADDAIHADHILTIGDQETGEGPTIDVQSSTEGLEATVVDIFGGDVSIKSSDDAINAANKDGLYEGELDYAVNMTGGEVDIVSGGDGVDSNGDVNLVDGSMDIRSSSVGGEAGIDYDGDLYVSNEFELNNNSGVAGPDGMPGQMGQMGGMPGQMGETGQQMGGQPGQMGQGQGQMAQVGGQQMGGQPGQMGGQFGRR